MSTIFSYKKSSEVATSEDFTCIHVRFFSYISRNFSNDSSHSSPYFSLYRFSSSIAFTR